MRTHSKGFTLIELLVVISIIGMLASVILVSLQGARAKARDAQRVQGINQMRTAMELIRSANGGSYPTTSGSEQAISTGTYGSLAPYIGSGKIISALPGISGEQYHYISDGTNYLLYLNTLENTAASGAQKYSNVGGNAGSVAATYSPGATWQASGTSGNGVVTAYGFSPASIAPNGTATTNLNMTLSQSASCSFTLDSETGLGGDELGLGGLSGPYNAGSFSFTFGPFTQSGSATVGVSCTGGGTGSASFDVTN